MADLHRHKIARLRRSAGMGASGLSRERALTVLTQLLEVTEHRDNLIAELVATVFA